jgi:FAD synthase
LALSKAGSFGAFFQKSGSDWPKNLVVGELFRFGKDFAKGLRFAGVQQKRTKRTKEDGRKLSTNYAKWSIRNGSIVLEPIITAAVVLLLPMVILNRTSGLVLLRKVHLDPVANP